MSAQRLIAEFDRLAEAPDAVPQLRRFILELAVRGRLVPHDVAEEDAAELLTRIARERAGLGREGKARRGKALPMVGADEAPFKIPPAWKWVRIREVTTDRGQLVPTSDFSYIDVGSIDKEAGRLGEIRVTTASEAPDRARKIVEKGDVIYSCVRPTLLNIAIIDRDISPRPIASTAFAVLHGFGLVEPRYLWIVLRSPYLSEIVESKMRGQAYPAINDAEFAVLPIPLPPLAEQRRIAAKVDELMVLCDRLEAAQAERERRRDRLAAAALSRLRALNEGDASQTQASGISALIRAVTRGGDIEDCHALILDLAVQGRLEPRRAGVASVPGDNADERRIEIQIPEGWRWVAVSEVAEARLGKMLDKVKNTGRPFPYLANTNVHWFSIRADDLKSVPLSDDEVEKYLLKNGDILICEGGHGIARSAVWRSSRADVAFQKALHRVRPGPELDPDFFTYCMFVYERRGILKRYYTGVGIPHFTGKALAELTFPLPPIGEQQRIVARVREIESLLSELRVRFAIRDTRARELLVATLQFALSGVDS